MIMIMADQLRFDEDLKVTFIAMKTDMVHNFPV
jgi:hypothetical protein